MTASTKSGRYDTGRFSSVRRVDLHCHSNASTEADEALLLAIKCPESYSEPKQVYAQAKSRGMDFVTITDHDSLKGVKQLTEPDVLTGEELTCYFPEDRCKIHLLVWGLSDEDHAALQAVASDIYEVANVIWNRDLAHAVAHPLYRQNDVLDRWHVERLLLLFRGFECVNGAHSMLHREAFEPLLDRTTEDEIRRLERLHGLSARGAKPWIKVRTGGSDDHGLFNIGRTWTEFPADADSPAKIIEYLKTGQCRPGGEAGSSIKLAHNFYGVGIRYYTREMAGKGSGGRQATLLRRLVGDEPSAPGVGSLLSAGLRLLAGGAQSRLRNLLRVGSEPRGVALLESLMTSAVMKRFADRGERDGVSEVFAALKQGRPALAEHEAIFSLMAGLCRDVSGGVADNAAAAVERGELGKLFDLVSTLLSQQALLAPYYFALFLQNQERHLFSRLTGNQRRLNPENLRVAVMTDDYGAGCEESEAFAAAVSRVVKERGWKGMVIRCGSQRTEESGSMTFAQLASTPLGLGGVTLRIPPVLEILEFADRHQFDAVVLNSSGPMAAIGLLVAKMLRIPTISVLNVNPVATMLGVTDGDYRMSAAAQAVNRWLHGSSEKVVVRSRTGESVAETLGIDRTRIEISPSSGRPNPAATNPETKGRLRVWVPLAFASRSSVELTTQIILDVSRRMDGVQFIASGRGRFIDIARKELTHQPVQFVADEPDIDLCDILVDTSTHDLTARRVISAMTAGKPAIISSASAGAEYLEDEVSGRIMHGQSATEWAGALLELLSDPHMHSRMGRFGMSRAKRLGTDRDIDNLWNICTEVVRTHIARIESLPPKQEITAGERNPSEGAILV